MESEVRKEYFTRIYLKFTQAYSQLEVQEDEPDVRIPEKTIRCIWNDQLLKVKQLQTTDGEKLEIVFPGYWNFGGGPDFTKAVIKVAEKTYEGDVELHVYSTDWKSHRHSRNPAYDNVILHVFMWKKRGAQTAAPKVTAGHPGLQHDARIFELELKSFLKKGILELNEQLDFSNYPVINKFNHGLCHEPLRKLPKPKLTHLLNAAGDARINTKMNRFHDRIIIHGYEQIFYEGIAEALGYPNNRKPFQMLAEILPLATLKSLLPARAKDDEKVLHLQAILFGVSGLIGFNTKSLPPDDQKYFATLLQLWGKYRGDICASPIEAEHWKFGGIRPSNYPYRRIAGLSHLIVRHWGIFADYIEVLKSSVSETGGYTVPAAKIRELRSFFCVESRDYWADHYAPGGKKLAHPQQLIGPDRSREIIINIAIPIGLIYARAGKSVALEAGLSHLFQSSKSTTDNKWIRFMKQYIFGDKKELIDLLTSDKQTQGLMQIYQDFCTQNKNNCQRCQFPTVVEKYFT